MTPFAAVVNGTAMMPSWLYRIVRAIVPAFREQDERLQRTASLVAAAQATRDRFDTVMQVRASYTRAGRRLGDLRR